MSCVCILNRLADLTKQDQEKLLLQKAKNELESFIFETRDKLYRDEYEKCSVEEERESLRSKLMEAEDWQYEQEDSAGKDVSLLLEDIWGSTHNLDL